MCRMSTKPVTPWIWRPLSPGASATLIPDGGKEKTTSAESVQKDSKMSTWRQCLRYRGRRSRSTPPERAAVSKTPEFLVDRPMGRGVGRAWAPSSGAVVPATPQQKVSGYKAARDPRPQKDASNTSLYRTTSVQLASEAAPPPYFFRGQMLRPTDDKKESREPVAHGRADEIDDDDEAYFTAEEF